MKQNLICIDCGIELSEWYKYRTKNKYGVPLCVKCSGIRRRHPRKHCFECNKELDRSYECTNSTGKDLCRKCVSKYLPGPEPYIPNKICVDCGDIIKNKYHKSRNKEGINLCRKCSNIHRIKPRLHCNDCNKELCRNYKIQNKYGFPLCNKCRTIRQIAERPPSKKEEFQKKPKRFCYDCNKTLSRVSNKQKNMFGVALCSDCFHKRTRGIKQSEDTCKKKSIARKGINVFGSKENHPWYGRKHKPESIEKMRKTKTGKPSPKKGKPQPQTAGPNNPSWKGGTSFEPYCYRYNKRTKQEVRNKYNGLCLNCNKTEEENGRKHSTHHLYYNKQDGCNGSEIRIIPLCNSCHGKTQGNKDYWQHHLKDLVNFWNIKEVWSWWENISY